LHPFVACITFSTGGTFNARSSVCTIRFVHTSDTRITNQTWSSFVPCDTGGARITRKPNGTSGTRIALHSCNTIGPTYTLQTLLTCKLGGGEMWDGIVCERKREREREKESKQNPTAVAA